MRFYSMDDVYACLDSTELPVFEDNVSHKMYVYMSVLCVCEEWLSIT